MIARNTGHTLLPVFLSLLLLALAGCSSAPSRPTPGPSSEPAASPAALEASTPEEARPLEAFFLNVAAVGDIMMGTDYPENALPPEDGAGLFAPVEHWLKDADITFGNLEGVLLDGGKAFKVCKPQAPCYVFRTPARYVQHLVKAGFKAMSVANNHARDFGEEGRDATIAALVAAGIHQSGRANEYAVWEVKGHRVAMVAFAPYGGSNYMLDLPAAAAAVAQLASQNEFVIVSFHGGAEGAGATRVPFQRELFHGEDRGDVVAFARAMVDAGASLVIGHGPHVPRALELYKDRLIAYSLGNFATYQGINVSGISGLAPILQVTLARDGAFVGGHIHSARQVRPGGPVPDASHEAARLMAELTRADFPATALAIDAKGKITPRSQAAAR